MNEKNQGENRVLMKEKNQGDNRILWMSIFSIGNAGYEMLFEFFKNFQNFFLTEICHLNTGLTGGLLSTVNLLKAVFTPVSGMIIDKDRFKAREKASPWIIGMQVFESVLFAIFSFLAWKGANMTLISRDSQHFPLLPCASPERLPFRYSSDGFQ